MSFVLSLMFLSLASAQADDRNCATAEALRARAEAEVIVPHQRAEGVACIFEDARISAGDVVRDSYRFTYACKATTESARVTLVTVGFADSEIRPFHCATDEDLRMTVQAQATGREF
jgi:hypothetical protein